MEVVASVDDGIAAVAAARALSPDVCVLDVSMPGMNGFDAARAIRARGSTARIIMLSMHSGAEHVFQAFDAGALGYVLKDAAAEEVVGAVRSAHRGRRYVSPAIALPERATEQGPIDSLSSRERQVLQLVAEGKSSAEIAVVVHISPKSVQTYRARIMKKLGVGDVAALVKFAIRHGLTPPD